jgi:hypothetical protein
MPMQPSSEPLFDFAHLVDVQSFLSTARDTDFALTIDSIERYEHGFVLVMWVEATEGPLHLFAISAADDVGNRYMGRMVAGYGGGSPEARWVNRVVYSFTPPLEPTTRSLKLSVTHARRIRFDRSSAAGTQPEEILGGPWAFSFDLSAPGTPGRVLPAPRPDSEPLGDDSPIRPSVLPPTMVRNVAHRPEGFVPPPRFEPSQLRRVISVIQQQERERFAITMLSLEIYSDGFFAVVRTDYPEARLHLPHTFHWRAQDDLGTEYWPRSMVGSGGGFPGQPSSWRLDCPFIPALNPDARELRLRLDDIEFGKSPHGPLEPQIPIAISGPWEFVVALR